MRDNHRFILTFPTAMEKHITENKIRKVFFEYSILDYYVFARTVGNFNDYLLQIYLW